MILDFSNTQVWNLAAAKRKLEIPAPAPPIANLLVVPITAAENIPAFEIGRASCRERV